MNSTDTLVKIIMDRWNGAMKNCDELLNTLTDEQLAKETAPGKNRGIYLLGHLIAVHDAMLPLLDLGPLKYPQLAKPFLEEADKVATDLPSVQELRTQWNEQKQDLKQQFEKLSTSNWLEKHTAVSAEDFAKEPHRCKLNIILTRTTHLTYHTGQLILLK